MANLTTENINTLAQLASSIGDGDYIYIYKASSGTFARIEKSLLMQATTGGGMSTEIYNAIKSNVNIIQSTLDELLNKLANIALRTGKPNTIGTLSWPSLDGGGDSVGVPTLMIDKNELNIVSAVGSAETGVFVITGTNLVEPIRIIKAGDASSLFELSSDTIPAANNVNVEILVTFRPISAGYKNITIVVQSGNLSKTLVLSGMAAELNDGISVDVISNLSHCHFENTPPTFVNEGGSVTLFVVPDDGYTLSSFTFVTQPTATDGDISTYYDSTTGKIVITVDDIYDDTIIDIGNISASQLEVAKVSVQKLKSLSKSGGVVDDEYGCYTEDYIAIPTGVTELIWRNGFSLNRGNNMDCLVFYNSSFSAFGSSSNKASDGGYTRTIQVPNGAAYLRASFALGTYTQTSATIPKRTDIAGEGGVECGYVKYSDSQGNDVFLFDGSDKDNSWEFIEEA